jgi:uncharacterized lipoprotein
MGSHPSLGILGLGLVIAGVMLSGCSHENTLRCGSVAMYESAQSVRALRIPDDLSVPDETESLRVPNASQRVAGAESPAAECLELAPFLSDSADPDS